MKKEKQGNLPVLPADLDNYLRYLPKKVKGSFPVSFYVPSYVLTQRVVLNTMRVTEILPREFLGRLSRSGHLESHQR